MMVRMSEAASLMTDIKCQTIVLSKSDDSYALFIVIPLCAYPIEELATCAEVEAEIQIVCCLEVSNL